MSSVLLIEDNEDDVFIMKRAMLKLADAPSMYVAVNGKEALDYLQAIVDYPDRKTYPIPSLIFLDLKLPLIDGFEVLAWIERQPLFKNIPVVVLTSSPEERDRRKAEEFKVKMYLVKPPTPEMLREAFKLL